MNVSRRDIAVGAAAMLASGCSHVEGDNAMTPQTNRPREPIVETKCGKVRGRSQDGVFVFKGIPYGASTAGANRFMAPVPAKSWAGVRDCLEWGPNAPQSSSSNAMPQLGSDFREFFGLTPDVPAAQSEDCLILNVFSPGLDANKRPVMVWIHGGGFDIGSGSGSRSNGVNLASRQDVVTVTVNHRLGVLGYCDLSGFSDEFARSGTVGQLDLIAAMEWVRDNIGAFGGDPAKVMIHGESGGGAKIAILLAMPGAKGLFTRAVCQSGVATGRLPDAERAGTTASALLEQLQVKPADLKKLQEAPVEQVLAAVGRMPRGPGGMLAGFVPSLGGADLPVSPIEAVAAGSGQAPLIVGCTKHESALMMASGGMNAATMTDQQLEAIARGVLGKNAPEIIAAYRALHRDYTPGDILIRAMSDGTRIASIKFAEAHVKGGGAPTYMYLFTWESPVLPHLKSAHGIDGTFYLGNTETVNIAAGNQEARTLAAAASAAWANFARTGAPASSGLPPWPEYTLENRETMILSASPHIEADPMKADRLMRERLAS